MLLKLPEDVRRQARETYGLFSRNPNHPSLRFKKIHRTNPIYSVRISIDYRAVGVLHGQEIVWFWIGPHGGIRKDVAPTVGIRPDDSRHEAKSVS
ncbi:MAG TPA: hypothetical protein PLQ35_09195 [bacterium]|nr:hypothetical protein [bacterium]HQL62457.1 hypothetical protein [bacterium]